MLPFPKLSRCDVICRSLLPCILLAGNVQAQISSVQSLDTIQHSAEQHLRELLPQTHDSNVLIQATALDRRLRLAACTSPLQSFLPNGASMGSRATVGVRCTSGNGWVAYVSVNIESEVNVLRLNKAMARNAAISEQDIEVARERVAGIGAHYISNTAALRGMRLKRDLPAGALLTPAMLQAELIVRRGQQVTLLAGISGIEVRNQGVALADAGIKDRIKVRNLTSAKVVEGVVEASGVVRITL